MTDRARIEVLERQVAEMAKRVEKLEREREEAAQRIRLALGLPVPLTGEIR